MGFTGLMGLNGLKYGTTFRFCRINKFVGSWASVQGQKPLGREAKISRRPDLILQLILHPCNWFLRKACDTIAKFAQKSGSSADKYKSCEKVAYHMVKLGRGTRLGSHAEFKELENRILKKGKQKSPRRRRLSEIHAQRHGGWKIQSGSTAFRVLTRSCRVVSRLGGYTQWVHLEVHTIDGLSSRRDLQYFIFWPSTRIFYSAQGSGATPNGCTWRCTPLMD